MNPLDFEAEKYSGLDLSAYRSGLRQKSPTMREFWRIPLRQVEKSACLKEVVEKLEVVDKCFAPLAFNHQPTTNL